MGVEGTANIAPSRFLFYGIPPAVGFNRMSTRYFRTVFPSISTTITVAMGSVFISPVVVSLPLTVHLAHLERSTVSETISAHHGVLHVRQRKRIALPAEEGEIQLPRLRRNAVIGARQEDRLATRVLRPRAHLAQLVAERSRRAP